MLRAGHEQDGCNKKGSMEKWMMENQWGHPEQKHKPGFNFQRWPFVVLLLKMGKRAGPAPLMYTQQREWLSKTVS